MTPSDTILVSIKKYKTPLIHITVWAVFFLLPMIFSSSNFRVSNADHHVIDEFYLLNIINKIFIVGLFYLNIKWLIVKLLYEKRYGQFLLSQLVIFMILIGFDFLLFQALQIKHSFHIARSAYHHSSLFLFISLISVAFKLVSDKAKIEEKQNENIKTELSFLRSQISPHFLFNVLNNIVAMIRLKHEDLEDTVVKLSALLQYMLYDTDEEKVSLQSEIEYLKTYIELQSQRFGSKIKITTSFDVDNSHLSIEPMLLIPFVENAFKHGYGMVKSPTIDIKINLEKEILVFGIQNKYSLEDQQKDKTSGIGLGNVTRRLALLYPKKYTLKIDSIDGWYIVQLELNLNNR